MRVLVVEDEEVLAKNIAQLLRESCGYAVDISNDGIDGLHQAVSSEYDLILLDIMLPGMDGLEILRQLRARANTTPVLMLTARGELDDLITGLDLGADDYLRKPFELRELVARCRALIRRHYRQASSVLVAGSLELNTQKRSVHVDGAPVELTAMEYKTLEYLLMRQGEVASKTEISEHLYDFQWERYSNVIESYVSSLRRKLHASDKMAFIQTVRGHGYMIDAK